MAKQKLSPKARAAKATRDLAAANTPRREQMRAENQRKRRAAKKAGVNVSGKDYDHNSSKFESVSENRGNGGRGTKSESPFKRKTMLYKMTPGSKEVTSEGTFRKDSVLNRMKTPLMKVEFQDLTKADNTSSYEKGSAKISESVAAAKDENSALKRNPAIAKAIKKKRADKKKPKPFTNAPAPKGAWRDGGAFSKGINKRKKKITKN